MSKQVTLIKTGRVAVPVSPDPAVPLSTPRYFSEGVTLQSPRTNIGTIWYGGEGVTLPDGAQPGYSLPKGACDETSIMDPSVIYVITDTPDQFVEWAGEGSS